MKTSRDSGLPHQEVCSQEMPPPTVLSKGAVWWLAARPKTLPASVAPLVLGNALAFGHPAFSWGIALTSLCCAILLQIGVNLANDYFDFKSGVDSGERLGPVRATQSGLISEARMCQAMMGVLFGAALLGVVLILRGGESILLLGIASLLASLAYSGGPYPLASHGLGELTVFVFFGLVAVGASHFLQTGAWSLEALTYGGIAGLPIAAIMLVNNTRDRDSDKLAGKWTLSARWGRAFSFHLYRALLLIPFALILLLVLAGPAPGLSLAAVLLLPWAGRLIRKFEAMEGRGFNDLLASTARFSLVLCVILAGVASWASGGELPPPESGFLYRTAT